MEIIESLYHDTDLIIQYYWWCYCSEKVTFVFVKKAYS